MLDRRNEQRSRTYRGGQVAFNNRWSTMECLVRNLSEGGARIEFAEPAFIPDDLDLIVPLRGYSTSVRVVWRQARAMGVSFVEKNTGTIIPIEVARQIRKLKTERDMLARRVKELSGSLT